MRRTTLLTIALALTASVLSAATFNSNDAYEKEAPISPDGLLTIDNPFGNVDVVGVDGATTVAFTVRRVVRGADPASVDEGVKKSPLLFVGDNGRRTIRTGVPLVHDPRWSIGVSYVIRVPRGVSIKLLSHSSERLHIVNINGSVEIKNTNGVVALENVTGPVSVDSANGSITFDSPNPPSSDVELTSINGNVEVYLPAGAPFRWTGQTLRGDFFSTIPVTGKFTGPNFRAAAPNTVGPQIVTNAMMGNVYLLRRGTKPAQAKSMRDAQAPDTVMARSFNAPFHNGDLIYSTPLGNIAVGQVRGAARVETRAGEVRLGLVQAQCDVISNGGPLTLGDIMGPLTARTRAGDVIINAAHAGSTVSTGGGFIRMLFAAGSTNLHSDGGDINVRQASGPITAITSSGDVTIGVDPTVRSVPIDVKTEQGNVTLTISSLIAADIEATLVTSDADANAIHSDFPGLTFRRDQVGTKTRIRASGKVNGGGERIYLYAEDGDITIHSDVPSSVSAPRFQP